MKETKYDKIIMDMISDKAILVGSSPYHERFIPSTGETITEKIGTIEIYANYVTSITSKAPRKKYNFGFSITENDKIEGCAAVRLIDEIFYGKSVKEIMTALVKNKKVSFETINSLICFLILKFPDSSSDILKWKPDEEKKEKQ
jgi:hypothetical protein